MGLPTGVPCRPYAPHQTHLGGAGENPKDRVKKGRLSFEKGSHVLFPGVVESFENNKVIPAVE